MREAGLLQGTRV